MGRGSTVRRVVVFGVAPVAAVLLAALLAEPVRAALVDVGWLTEDPARPHHLFLKVFRRLLVFGLGAWFVLAFRPWRDGTLRVWGLAGPPVRARPALVAWLATVAFGALLYGFRTARGWHVAEHELGVGVVAQRLLTVFAVGLVVGLVEEWFFRGWLFGRLGRAKAPVRAALGSSAIYAALHAFRPGALDAVDVAHDAGGALHALGAWLAHLADVAAFGPTFLGLFLFGMLLAGLFERTANLWVPIAVHAAAVFVIKGQEAFLDVARGVETSAWAGSHLLADGAPTWGLLAAASVFVWRFRSKATPEPRAG